MGNYQNLSVWKRAHDLALKVYRATRCFPSDERYALTSQVRRAAVSIVSNIAESSGRSGNREQVRFLSIALSSTRELESQLLLSRDIGYLKPEDCQDLSDACQEVGRMLNGLIRFCRQGRRAGAPDPS
jgi:four helix bundle protein